MIGRWCLLASDMLQSAMNVTVSSRILEKVLVGSRLDVESATTRLIIRHVVAVVMYDEMHDVNRTAVQV